MQNEEVPSSHGLTITEILSPYVHQYIHVSSLRTNTQTPFFHYTYLFSLVIHRGESGRSGRDIPNSADDAIIISTRCVWSGRFPGGVRAKLTYNIAAGGGVCLQALVADVYRF